MRYHDLLDALYEARRNPEQNPRTNIISELLKYEGQDDIFLTFTQGMPVNTTTRMAGRKPKGDFEKRKPKVGINPKSSYNTPLGIYCYPIDEVLKHSIEKNKIGARYTGRDEWNFLYVLRRKSRDGVIETAADAQPYLDKLKSVVEQMGQEAKILFDASLKNPTERNARGELWNATRILSTIDPKKNKTSAAWNYIMRKIGVKQFVDRDEQGLIHNNEPTQAVFFDPTAFNVVTVLSRTISNDIERVQPDMLSSDILNGKIKPETFNPIYIQKLTSGGYYKALEKIYYAAPLLLRRTMDKVLSRIPVNNLEDVNFRSNMMNNFEITANDITRLMLYNDIGIADVEYALSRPLEREEMMAALSTDSKSLKNVDLSDYSFIDEHFVEDLMGKYHHVDPEILIKLQEVSGVDLSQYLDTYFLANPMAALNMGYQPDLDDWMRLVVKHVGLFDRKIMDYISEEDRIKVLETTRHNPPSTYNTMLYAMLNSVAKIAPELTIEIMGNVDSSIFPSNLALTNPKIYEAIREHYTEFFIKNPLVACGHIGKPYQWYMTPETMDAVTALSYNDAFTTFKELLFTRCIEPSIAQRYLENEVFFEALVKSTASENLLKVMPAQKYARMLFKNRENISVEACLMNFDQIVEYMKLDPTIGKNLSFSRLSNEDLIKLFEMLPRLGEYMAEHSSTDRIAALWERGALSMAQIPKERRSYIIYLILANDPTTFLKLFNDPVARPLFGHIAVPNQVFKMWNNTPEIEALKDMQKAV